MLRSMTGFGRMQDVVNGLEILVEIRSVNHRYYEFNSRLPRSYAYLDETLKSFLKGSIARGKVEVSVTLNHIEGKDALIQVNPAIASGYVNALREANEYLHLQDNLTLAQLARFPDIFCVQKTVEDENEVWAAVMPVAKAALERFVQMREAEGERLREDLLQKLRTVEQMLCEVEQASPGLTIQYRDRLYAKIQELLASTDIDEQRILTEAAIFSEKVAVDEETVRLHSHIAQFRELMKQKEPVGRKLDFLVQEMNREVNTIGSKVQDLVITKIVVNLKSEIEKIREQIQNIE